MIGLISTIVVTGTVLFLKRSLKEKEIDQLLATEQQKRTEQKTREEVALNMARKIYFERNYQQQIGDCRGYMGYKVNGYLHTSGAWYKGY